MGQELEAEMFNYNGPDKVIHFMDYLAQKSAASQRVKNFRSGFLYFDEKIDGLETGEVVVVTGHTKQGKTLFAESWIKSMMSMDPNLRAIIFSFEVQTEKLLVKYTDTPSLQVYVSRELSTMDFEWLRKRCLEAKLKYNCRIALIDHLHFMVDMNTKQNMSLNIGAFMRRLKKDVAIDMNMAVLLIAHQGQPKEGQEASVGGMRDSSFVGQEADSTIIVSRKKNFDGTDLSDFSKKYGEEKIQDIREAQDRNVEDEFSGGLATIKIANHRRTGIFDCKKLFIKKGHFLEEV